MAKDKPLDLEHFFQSRQDIAGQQGTVYAQRQVAGIRQLVQEAKLNRATKQAQKTPAKEDK